MCSGQSAAADIDTLLDSIPEINADCIEGAVAKSVEGMRSGSGRSLLLANASGHDRGKGSQLSGGEKT